LFSNGKLCDGRGEVVYRLTSVYGAVIWNDVNRLIRMKTK
jgi:hypothetical protein